ncbi:MAG: hypothetical protein PHE17_20385 [Thiothrix sp.]|uniref:hypothetical protein n=1 Tax=Thiothrix sp. TaxID=1032 RepID=UPI00260F9316|nr:hypothetical protein [Thiothrix sp.]MDD5395389.1 hypothetical protein [Thiothrix sp.]
MVAADLAWTIKLEDAHVCQRERTTLTVAVETTDRFATLEASLPRIEGVDVQALPVTNEASTTNGKRVLRLAWQLSAYTPGTQQIQLPAIRYNLNGRDAAQWQPPTQTLEVEALPPYLPPTLPVGKVSIESRIEPNGWLQPGHFAYWRVSLHSNTVATAQFPPILKQIQSNGNVETFPAIIGQSGLADGQFHLEYRIPFKPQSNGKLDLPVLHWHWFNPDTNRLEQVQHRPPRPWVMAWLWRGMLGLTGSLLLLAGVFLVGKIGKQRLQRPLLKQRVLQALRENTNPQAVQQAMRNCAIAHSWPENFSAQQWLQQWELHYGTNPMLQAILHKYEAGRFSKP